MLALILLLPLLLGALLSLIVPGAKNAKYVAFALSIISLLLLPFVSHSASSLTWLSLQGVTLSISTQIAPLNFVLLLAVLVIGPLIMAYSAGYMDKLSEHRRFYSEMLIFEAAMVLFAISANFVSFFIAWEFLTLMSYMLIGFWYSRRSAAHAARKALSIVFIGDISLFSAIVIFFVSFHTLQFSTIISALGASGYTPTVLEYSGALLLLVAVFTKSAQFPFHEWLADAMEGPTPVSAFLHSSTMVKAGVFAVISLLPIFLAFGPTLQEIILAFGLITTVLSTLNALRETHIKKIIAYSTVQELSLMLVLVGIGAYLAAIFFFFVQSFYKALVFFGSGTAMEASESESLYDSAGMKSNRIVYVTTAVSVLSIAGILPFSGFFVNTFIGYSVSSYTSPFYIFFSAIAFLTSLYIFRWFAYPSKSPGRVMPGIKYKATAKSMSYPMAILALLSLASIGFAIFLMSPAYLSGYPQYFSSGALGIHITDALIETAIAIIGLGAAYVLYWRHKAPAGTTLPHGVIYTRYAFNRLYEAAASLLTLVGSGAYIFDSYLNYSIDTFGRDVIQTGNIVRRVSSGNINNYALAFSVGLLLLFIYAYLVI